MEKYLIIILMALGCTVGAQAQSDDFGMWYSAGATKKLSKKWSVGAEGEFRTRNNTKTADRWTFGVSGTYKLTSWLKASAGYTFLYNNNLEKLTYKYDRPNKWTPSYWGGRHRVTVGIAGDVDWNRLNISLRERWQYTYRPEASDKKYNFLYTHDEVDGYVLEPVSSKNQHIWRNRLMLKYNIAKSKFEPFANVETFVGKSGLTKVRYQGGVEYKIQKKHILSLTYRFQDVHDDDDESDIHMIGLGYEYKF